ncbi:thioesterase family protein [Bradyrhizobium sp. CCBAU 53421]|uniref:thioesterase family protein n=1 Tax=Bradyrhizobium sp. CCBAU 53421 TaxID=1325120 RepID=UPI00188BEFF9|nr:thioesterase family protein [Bradyrhizobium sp. CCBAU 53421]QOZ33352.1 thioesterase family protein [Bradyrhizobium sp. CCBAU 53421]
MTAIFQPEGTLFRATEHAGGPWSPDMLQGSATTALMAREVERLAVRAGFAVRRLTFDLWRPAGLRAFVVETSVLRDGRKAKTVQVRLLDGDTEIGRCTALMTAQGEESPRDPFSPPASEDRAPETGSPPPAFAQKWSRYFQNVSVRLIEGALEKPGPAAAWMRLDVPLVAGELNTPLLQAVQAADFSSGVAQIVDMREWTFINPEVSLYFFRPPEGDWILIRSRTRVGTSGAGLTTATLSDRCGPFAEVMQAMSFERRAAAAQAS